MATAEQIQAVKEKWPVYAWLLDRDPEIRDLLISTIDTPDMTPEAFQAKLAQTSWYRSTDAARRQWETLNQVDPSTADSQLRAKQVEVWDIMRSLGFSGTAALGQKVGDISKNALALGLTPAQIQDQIGGMIQYGGKYLSKSPLGSIGTDMNRIRDMAANQYVKLSEPQAFEFARRIAVGELTVEDMDGYFRKKAIEKFSAITDEINSGITVKEYFAPHRSEIASILEVNENEIDLGGDSHWNQVLDYADPTTNKRRPMTLSETQRLARKDSRFKGTRQGEQIGAELYTDLAKTFGVMA